MVEWYHRLSTIGGFIFLVSLVTSIFVVAFIVVNVSIQESRDKRINKKFKSIIEEYPNEIE